MLNKWTQKQTLRHVLRPRILIYTCILLVIILAIVVSLLNRTAFKVDVVRDRGVMARVVDAGKTENVYRLQVMNASEVAQRYRFSVEGLPGLLLTSDDTLSVPATEARTLPVRVQLPFQGATPGSHEIHFKIESLDTPGVLLEKSTFIVPE